LTLKTNDLDVCILANLFWNPPEEHSEETRPTTRNGTLRNVF
jgi:hypothetical protein